MTKLKKVQSPALAKIWLLFVVLLAEINCMMPAYAANSGLKDWTILIYMNGKNNLEMFALVDFKELSAIGSSDRVNFVVQLGRPENRPRKQKSMMNKFEGWSGARRYYIKKGLTPSPGAEIEIVGTAHEVDMGNPNSLKEFLRWGKEKYPAKQFAVVIWNHGQGYRLAQEEDESDANNEMISNDAEEDETPSSVMSHRAISEDADTGSIIYNSDLRLSLDSVFDTELRFVGFDACLMATIETAYELRSVVPIMVASEELEPGGGWNYTSLAEAITSHPPKDERELALLIVESYRNQYGNNESTTLSALKLSDVNKLAAAITKMSDAILTEQQDVFPIIKSVRSERGSYNEARSPVTLDLIGFIDALESKLLNNLPSSSVLNHARQVRSLAQSIIIENYASSKRHEPYGSHGIAIYFPASKNAFVRDPWSSGYIPSNQFKRIDFVANEAWSKFLQTYLALPKE